MDNHSPRDTGLWQALRHHALRAKSAGLQCWKRHIHSRLRYLGLTAFLLLGSVGLYAFTGTHTGAPLYLSLPTADSFDWADDINHNFTVLNSSYSLLGGTTSFNALFVAKAGDTMTGQLTVTGSSLAVGGPLVQYGVGNYYSVYFTTDANRLNNTFAITNDGSSYLFGAATAPAYGYNNGSMYFTMFTGSFTPVGSQFGAGNLGQINMQLSGYRNSLAVKTVTIEGWNGRDHQLADIGFLTGATRVNGGQVEIRTSSGVPGATPIRVMRFTDDHSICIGQDDCDEALTIIPIGTHYFLGDEDILMLSTSTQTNYEAMRVTRTNSTQIRTVQVGDIRGALISTITTTGNIELVRGSTISFNGSISLSTAATVGLTTDPALYIYNSLYSVQCTTETTLQTMAPAGYNGRNKILAFGCNTSDMFISTGSGTDQWRNSRTGAGP